MEEPLDRLMEAICLSVLDASERIVDFPKMNLIVPSKNVRHVFGGELLDNNALTTTESFVMNISKKMNILPVANPVSCLPLVILCTDTSNRFSWLQKLRDKDFVNFIFFHIIYSTHPKKARSPLKCHRFMTEQV